MEIPTDAAINRRLRRIAASYRKQGYQVAVPSAPNGLPKFLANCRPDLIAEKDDDRVVIEVKASQALKGANDLTELAERVAAQPGWRLELVALKARNEDLAVAAPDWLERMLQPIESSTDDFLNCVYLNEVLADLLDGIASSEGIHIREKSMSRVAHELAYAGVIAEDLLERIKGIIAWRADLMHGLTVLRPTVSQTIEILKLCRDLHAQVQSSED